MIEKQITFETPSDVLSFVRVCLNDLDIDRLYNAVKEPTSDFWRERIFDDLREIEGSETLEDVFLVDNSFPEGETEYKMGGHSNRTRHLHLDLIRTKNAWCLKTIWKCR
jgi:hypothetical protein